MGIFADIFLKKMKNKLKYLLKRWQNRNSWWVCEYKIVGDTMTQTGKFAEFGVDEKEALENALKWIQKDCLVSGEVTYFVRRPNFLETFDI